MAWGSSWGSSWGSAWGDTSSSGNAWGNSWGNSWGVSWGDGETPPQPTPTPQPRAGVRRSRFLRISRTAPPLPWEVEPQAEVVIAKPRRKRIPLPALKALQEVVSPIPIQTVRTIDAPVIRIPELGTAVLEDDDEDWLWLI